MMRKRRVVSLMLVMVLCMGMTFQAQAANLSDAKKKAEELESKKEAAQSEKDSLSTQLEGILTESAELEKLIAEKVFKPQIWNERARGLNPEEELA